MLSRITSLGNDDNKFSSAIYFIGNNMTPDRIMDITHAKKGELYFFAFLRNCFVSYLKTHMHTARLTTLQQQEIFEWAEKKYKN